MSVLLAVLIDVILVGALGVVQTVVVRSAFVGIIRRLDRATTDAQLAARVLQVNVEVVQKLAEQDRVQLSRILKDLATNSATGSRIESAARGVAKDLVVAQRAVTSVASDLADSHRRADAVIDGNPGEAADAASQQTVEEKKSTKSLLSGKGKVSLEK